MRICVESSSNTMASTLVRTKTPDSKNIAVAVPVQFGFTVRVPLRGLISETAAYTSGLRAGCVSDCVKVESDHSRQRNRGGWKNDRSGEGRPPFPRHCGS
jgi:hypothetical protein